MHAGQLAVSPEMVRELVDSQFPGWSGLAVTAVESPGTVNAIFRVGGRLAARFPLRPGDAAAVRRRLESEAAAARQLAGRTRFGTPEPVAIGAPGAGYPLPWAVQTWLPGVTALDEDPGGSVAFAHDLAEFIGSVRAIGTGGRLFSGQGRGGDLGPADPALDLVAAWHLLDEDPRQALRADLRCDDLQWERGKAWAFEQAMGLVWYYADSNPAMSRTGRRTLERIQAGTSPG